MNELNIKLNSLLGVRAAYNPGCNGLVERQYRTTERAMVASLLEKQANWYYILPSLQMSFRTTRHTSTGLTPYEMMFGRRPLLPAELMYLPRPDISKEAPENIDDPWPTQKEVFDSAEKLRKVLYDHAEEQIKKAQDKQAKAFNARHKGHEIKVGDYVLIHNSKDTVRLAKILAFPWYGPFKVVEVRENGNLKVMNPKTGNTLLNKIPANRVQLYLNRSTYLPALTSKDAGNRAKIISEPEDELVR